MKSLNKDFDEYDNISEAKLDTSKFSNKINKQEFLLDNSSCKPFLNNDIKKENKEGKKPTFIKKLLFIIWLFMLVVSLIIMIVITSINWYKEKKEKEIEVDYKDAEKLIDLDIIEENRNLLDESADDLKSLLIMCNNLTFSEIEISINNASENLEFLINTNESSLKVAKDDLDFYNSSYDILSRQANSFTKETPEYFMNLSSSFNLFKNEVNTLISQFENMIKNIAIPFTINFNKTTQSLRVLDSEDLLILYKNEIKSLNNFYNIFFKNIKEISKKLLSSINIFENTTKSLVTKVISGISEFNKILELITKEKIHEMLIIIKNTFISIKNDMDNLNIEFDKIKEDIQKLEEDINNKLDIDNYEKIITNLNNIIIKLKQKENFKMSNITSFPMNTKSIKNTINNFSGAIEMLKDEIKFILETVNVETSTSLDLLFIMDITGSMRSYLEEAKNNILSIINNIIESCPGIDINLGFIGYRDFNEEYIDIDFTQNHAMVKNTISKVYAKGGGDIPEDVAFALELALNKTWKSNAKFAVFLADAPGHGKQYGGDDYEGEQPKRRLIEEMIAEMAENDISLFCLKILDQTDTMYKLFEDIYEAIKSSYTKFIIEKNKKVENSLLKQATSFSNVVVDNAILVYYDQRMSDRKECLVPQNSALDMLKTNYGIKNLKPDKNLRFILGKCNPVLLVPGIYSTKLQVEFNCKGLATEERSTTLKEIRLYCGDLVCKDETKVREEHRLLFSLKGPFSIMSKPNKSKDKYGSCLGHIANYFQNENECQKVNGKSSCFYSKYVKVAYYGGTEETLEKGKCGVEGIVDLIQGGSIAPGSLPNIGAGSAFKKISKSLISKGYKEGFSFGALPNDYRRYLATNNFATNVFKSQINRLYKNTGKPIVIIGHSYGTLLTLTNLLKNEKDKDFMKKIKKFIALAPPFAGSAELLDTFFHTTKSFNQAVFAIETNFQPFGQYLMYKSLPTVMELRPQSISSKIFTDSSFSELANALRGRLEIERDCKKRNCDASEIKSKTSNFDKLFKGYFPSLLDPECSYESNIGGFTEVLNRKCYTGIFNVGDCPSIIAKSENPNEYNFESDIYCNMFGDAFFYQGECDDVKRNCLDKIYYSNKCPNVYNNKEAIDFILERYNSNFAEKYGSISKSHFDNHETIRKAVENSIEYQKKISLLNELPIPPVDTELVYTSFTPTIAGLVLDDNDFTKEATIFKKGGDGTVPTWSSLLTGLKWIYEKKKKNLPQKIKLIEYCSRIAKSGQYKYDPNKNQNFAALSCRCIKSKENIYKKSISKCSHGDMLQDDNLIEYLVSVVFDAKELNLITDSKKKAVKDYDSKFDYTKECNDDIYKILNTVK